MKKLKGLFIFAISLMLVGVTGVSAATYDMETDMNASEFDFTEDTIINGNGHTINGNFSISTPGVNIEINNVTIDVNAPDNSTINAIELNAIGASLTLNEVTIIDYTKSGLYADRFSSLVIDGSTFDGSKTPEIGEGSGPEADLMKRSAAGIDINIGNSGTTEFSVERIEVTNSTFRNVLASTENTTGGGIKVKVKNWAHLTSMCDVVITNNTFTDNVRDLVVGTNAGGGDTTQAETGNITFKLLGNTDMKVVNNSSDAENEEDRTEIIEATDYLVELNYYDDTHKVLTEDETGLVVDPTAGDFDLNEALADVATDEAQNLVIDYGDYTITINKEDVKDDLTNTLTDLSLVVSEDTTTEALLEYVSEENTFIKTTLSGELPASQVVVGLNIVKYAGQTVNLYYLNADKLEFVSEVVFDADGNATISLEHYSEYVLSTTDLLDATTGGEVEIPIDPEDPTEPTIPETPEEEIENPSTNDNVLTYIILGIVSLAGVAGAAIYLKKKNS